jgi:hypothetical protein
MAIDDVIHERRSEKRKKVKMMFLVKIGKLYNEGGIAKDINRHGVCLICPQLFQPRTTIQPKDYIGKTLKIMFPSNGITINGVIAWVDLRKGEGAIKISRTTDDSRWQELCEKA